VHRDVERRSVQPDNPAVQYLWMVERASERILMTWTPANGGMIMIVVTHIGTTQCPSFAVSAETRSQGMQAALWDARRIHAMQLGAH
jgi:hypothetical protein